MLIVSWRKSGEELQTKEYEDDRLQELMDRANATFGNPERDLTGGPNMSSASNAGLQSIPKQHRQTSKRRPVK